MGTKKIKIFYYAILREQARRNEEILETKALTALELFEELKGKYSFSISKDKVRLAINNSFCDWKAAIKTGDEVVFIPPVAGG